MAMAIRGAARARNDRGDFRQSVAGVPQAMQVEAAFVRISMQAVWCWDVITVSTSMKADV